MNLHDRPCDAAQTVESGQRRVGRWVAVMAAVCGLAVLAADGLAAPGQRGKAKTIRRAAPPAGQWDKLTRGTFVDDAFALLEGSRPDYGSATQVVVAAAGGAASAAATSGGGTTGGMKWSARVSAATRALLGDRYRFEPRGEVMVKGSGPVETFFLLGPA